MAGRAGGTWAYSDVLGVVFSGCHRFHPRSPRALKWGRGEGWRRHGVTPNPGIDSFGEQRLQLLAQIRAAEPTLPSGMTTDRSTDE